MSKYIDSENGIFVPYDFRNNLIYYSTLFEHVDTVMPIEAAIYSSVGICRQSELNSPMGSVKAVQNGWGARFRKLANALDLLKDGANDDQLLFVDLETF